MRYICEEISSYNLAEILTRNSFHGWFMESFYQSFDEFRSYYSSSIIPTLLIHDVVKSIGGIRHSFSIGHSCRMLPRKRLQDW